MAEFSFVLLMGFYQFGWIIGYYSIHAKTPPRPVTQDQVDEMMDAAESMSLDDRELQEAAAQARAMMEANSRQTA